MGLINCHECGKEVSDTCDRCVHCGSSLSKPKFCTDCGAEMLPGQTVCPNCGKANNKKVLNLSLNKVGIIGALVVVAVIIMALSFGSKVDLREVYEEIGADSFYCSVTSDGSCLIIDTNPNDLNDYFSYTAFLYVKNANKALGFTEALFTKMGQTRAVDGTQHDENDKVEVSWTYHPDKGLCVVYNVK